MSQKMYLEESTVEVYGEIYDSKSSSSPRASHIISSWFSEGNIVNDINEYRPAVIEYFMKHCVEIKHMNGELAFEAYLLACVSWFQ